MWPDLLLFGNWKNICFQQSTSNQTLIYIIRESTNFPWKWQFLLHKLYFFLSKFTPNIMIEYLPLPASSCVWYYKTEENHSQYEWKACVEDRLGLVDRRRRVAGEEPVSQSVTDSHTSEETVKTDFLVVCDSPSDIEGDILQWRLISLRIWPQRRLFYHHWSCVFVYFISFSWWIIYMD